MKLPGYEEFVTAWQTSKIFNDVQAKFPDVSRASIYNRANYLRSKGVPLKAFSARNAKPDLVALKKLAESLNGHAEDVP